MTAHVGRLIFIALQVQELGVSTRFYRDVLGVPLDIGGSEAAAHDPWLGGEHQEHSWRTGAYLHLALFSASAERQPTERAQLGFAVDDLEAVHERAVAAGIKVLHPPREEPWGRTVRYEDPDGNIVGLTQVSKAEDAT